MDKKKKVKIISGCCLPVFWAGTVCFAYPGVMSTYWQETYNVGATETGLVMTFMLLALAFCMFFSGIVHRKIGIAKCILIGTLAYAIAFIVLMAAKRFELVYLWGFLSNVGNSFIYLPGLTTAQEVMPENRGLASGIFNLLFGISSGIMALVLNLLLASKGYMWVNTFTLVCIVIFGIIGMLMTWTYKGQAEEKMESTSEESDDMTVGQALRSKDFWIMWFIWAFMGAAAISMVTMSKGYAEAMGLAGVIVLTAFNFANGLIRIVTGYLTDLLGGKLTGFFAYMLTGICYILMPHTTNIVLVTLCAVGIGFGLGSLFTVSPPMISRKVGLKYFGIIYGLVYTAYGIVGGVIGPTVSGILLDKTGSYVVAFTYLGAFAIIGAVLILFFKDQTKKNQ